MSSKEVSEEKNASGNRTKIKTTGGTQNKAHKRAQDQLIKQRAELEKNKQDYYSLYEEYQAQNEELKAINEELSQEVEIRKIREEELAESERKFRETVKYLDEGYYSVTVEGSLLEHNLAFNRIFGIEPEKDMKGAAIQDFWQDPMEREYYLKELMERGSISNYQINVKNISGEPVVVMVNAHLVRAVDGDISNIQGTIIDITEQKKNEESLRKSENELRIRNRLIEAFLNIQDEEMYSEVLDIVLEAMESQLGVFGYIDEQGDLIVPTMTRQVWDQCNVHEKDIRFPHENWENSNSTWPTAIREKRAIYSNEPSSRIPEGHMKISRNLAVPIINKGRPIGLLQVANKKTDYTTLDIKLLETLSRTIAPMLQTRLLKERQEKIRQKAEEALVDNENKYRTLVENIPQKIFMKDTSFRWVSVNENMALDLGLKPEEVSGKVDYDFFPKELSDKYRADDKRIIETGATEDIEERYIQDGENLWVHTIKTPVRNDRGEIIGILGIFWDITEQKKNRLERERLTIELMEKNQELEQIVYITSHDLRSPLVNIQGFNSELREIIEELGSILNSVPLDKQSRNRIDVLINEDIPEALKYIFVSITKMDSLLKGLLALSRVGRVTLHKERINMNQMLDEISNSLDYQIKESGIRFSKGNLPDCTGDRTQMNQVFTNLIENAIKFMDPDRKGKIKVTGREEGEKQTYCIEDNGIGIEKEHQDNVFNLFHKLKTTSQGEGLGLAIVKKIIERHGGNVRIESETGRGSKFYISL